MRLTNRFVRIFQWIAPVLLPAFILVGRGLLGAPLGWMLVIGVVLAPLATIAMYVPPVVFVFDREAAAARKSRLWYDVANYVLWSALIVVGLSLQDGGDTGDYGSVLSTWGVLDHGGAEVVFVIALIVSVLAWVGVLVAAIMAVVLSRRGSAAVTR